MQRLPHVYRRKTINKETNYLCLTADHLLLKSLPQWATAITIFRALTPCALPVNASTLLSCFAPLKFSGFNEAELGEFDICIDSSFFEIWAGAWNKVLLFSAYVVCQALGRINLNGARF